MGNCFGSNRPDQCFGNEYQPGAHDHAEKMFKQFNSIKFSLEFSMDKPPLSEDVSGLGIDTYPIDAKIVKVKFTTPVLYPNEDEKNDGKGGVYSSDGTRKNSIESGAKAFAVGDVVIINDKGGKLQQYDGERARIKRASSLGDFEYQLVLVGQKFDKTRSAKNITGKPISVDEWSLMTIEDYRKMKEDEELSSNFNEEEEHIDMEIVDFSKDTMMDDYSLTPHQLKQCALNQSTVVFADKFPHPKNKSQAVEVTQEFHAKNGDFFTVEELLNCICKFEYQTRVKSNDRRFINFEGIKVRPDGRYRIMWGAV